MINLISKVSPKGVVTPSASGTFKANIGTGDRYDIGADGVYTAPGLSLNGGLAFRRSGFNRNIGSQFELPNPATGALIPANELVVQGDRADTLTMHGSAGYDLDPKDHLDANVSAITERVDQSQNTTYQTSPLAGAQAVDYAAPGSSPAHFASVSESLGLTHTLPGDGQSVSVKLALSQGHFIAQNRNTYAFDSPAQQNLYQDLTQTEDFPELDLQIDYKVTLPNKAKLAIGYEGKLDWQSETNYGAQGGTAALAAINPVFAQNFTFQQQLEAIYVTYDQTFGKLDVQPGLRLETATIDTDLVSAGEKGRQKLFRGLSEPAPHL